MRAVKSLVVTAEPVWIDKLHLKQTEVKILYYRESEKNKICQVEASKKWKD